MSDASRLFVSHCSADRALAEPLCAALESAGAACWIAPRDIPPGATWAAAIVRAIEDASALLLLLTQRSNASSQVAREVACAADAGVPLLPIRLEEVALAPELRYYLGAEQWIDGLVRPIEAALPTLVQRILERARPRASAPPTEEWAPATERLLTELSSDLAQYRDLTFRLHASLSDPTWVLAVNDDAHRVYVDTIVAYNAFGVGFMQRLHRQRSAIRKYWGAEASTHFNEFHAFLETEIYRGCVFRLNDVRNRINELRNVEDRTLETCREVDAWKAPLLASVRASLEELSQRADALLARLEHGA